MLWVPSQRKILVMKREEKILKVPFNVDVICVDKKKKMDIFLQ